MRDAPETADELFENFRLRYPFIESNPRASAAFYRDLAERVAKNRADAWPIVVEARALGRQIDDIWWFVNTSERYPECIPMLVRHLDVPHRLVTIDGLVRALAVEEARGIATQSLLCLLRREHEVPLRHPDAVSEGEVEMHRAAMAVSVRVTADRTALPELERMVKDARYARVAKELKRAIARARRR